MIHAVEGPAFRNLRMALKPRAPSSRLLTGVPSDRSGVPANGSLFVGWRSSSLGWWSEGGKLQPSIYRIKNSASPRTATPAIPGIRGLSEGAAPEARPDIVEFGVIERIESFGPEFEVHALMDLEGFVQRSTAPRNPLLCAKMGSE